MPDGVHVVVIPDVSVLGVRRSVAVGEQGRLDESDGGKEQHGEGTCNPAELSNAPCQWENAGSDHSGYYVSYGRPERSFAGKIGQPKPSQMIQKNVQKVGERKLRYLFSCRAPAPSVSGASGAEGRCCLPLPLRPCRVVGRSGIRCCRKAGYWLIVVVLYK